jgi:hypothetical protein
MSKKLWQIFSLILSVLGLIYLCLSYYGIIRYFKLRYTDTEYYISNYVKKPKIGKDRIVISFEGTEKNMKPFINSVLDQTVRVDDIGIYLNKDIPIPESLKKILSVYRCDKDYDNAGNLISSILREPETNTKIIILEPNKIYGEDFIQNIIEQSDKNPEKIIKVNKTDSEMLVKPKFFTEKITNYKKGKGKTQWVEECFKGEIMSIDYSPIFK